jgi:hypothetical protein
MSQKQSQTNSDEVEQKKIKCLSRSPLSSLKISYQSEYVWISKNGSEYTALMLDENAKVD